MRIVVLGTGTNVGKTYVTARLAAALRGSARVLALKPIESGVVDGGGSDAEAIALAAGHALVKSPWRFIAPVSPHLAARQAGLTLALGEIVDWVASEEAKHAPTLTLIETAGGAFSPLAPGVTNAALAQALQPALWLLVAPDALGVLHDVSATQLALAAYHRAPDALVLTSARTLDASSGSNAAELRALGIANPLLTLAPGAEDVQELASWVRRASSVSPVL